MSVENSAFCVNYFRFYKKRVEIPITDFGSFFISDSHI